jgi:hypothetical protein
VVNDSPTLRDGRVVYNYIVYETFLLGKNKGLVINFKYIHHIFVLTETKDKSKHLEWLSHKCLINCLDVHTRGVVQTMNHLNI